MTKITHYNEFGTKSSRIVSSYSVEGDDARAISQEAVYRAAMWNKTETRENMRVNFILIGSALRVV